MQELWKPVNGYERLYEVGNLGNVRSLEKQIMTGKNFLRTYEAKTLSPAISNKGYKRVLLCKNGITKNFSVHRIVALNFIEGYSKELQINHINGIKTDNRAVNLEWVTSKQNTIHAHKNGLVKGYKRTDAHKKLLSDSKKGLNHPFSKPVIDLNTGVFYNNITDASKILGISASTLSLILKNKTTNYRFA